MKFKTNQSLTQTPGSWKKRVLQIIISTTLLTQCVDAMQTLRRRGIGMGIHESMTSLGLREMNSIQRRNIGTEVLLTPGLKFIGRVSGQVSIGLKDRFFGDSIKIKTQKANEESKKLLHELYFSMMTDRALDDLPITMVPYIRTLRPRLSYQRIEQKRMCDSMAKVAEKWPSKLTNWFCNRMFAEDSSVKTIKRDADRILSQLEALYLNGETFYAITKQTKAGYNDGIKHMGSAVKFIDEMYEHLKQDNEIYKQIEGKNIDSKHTNSDLKQMKEDIDLRLQQFLEYLQQNVNLQALIYNRFGDYQIDPKQRESYKYKALENYNIIIKVVENSSMPTLHHNISAVYYNKGTWLCENTNQSAEAQKMLEKANDLAPGDPYTLMQLARSYVEREPKERTAEKFKRANRIMQSAINIKPLCYDIRISYAELLMMQWAINRGAENPDKSDIADLKGKINKQYKELQNWRGSHYKKDHHASYGIASWMHHIKNDKANSALEFEQVGSYIEFVLGAIDKEIWCKEGGGIKEEFEISDRAPFMPLKLLRGRLGVDDHGNGPRAEYLTTQDEYQIPHGVKKADDVTIHDHCRALIDQLKKEAGSGGNVT